MRMLRDVRRARWVLGALLLGWLGIAYWQTHKSLAPGTHTAAAWQPVPQSALKFVADLTAADAYGRPIVNHGILDEVLSVIAGARDFVVIDCTLAEPLRAALIARKRTLPQLHVVLLIDPIEKGYGAEDTARLEELQAAGLEVVTVDLDRLRDSNFMYSSLWRMGLRWWGHGRGPGWVLNPFALGPPRLTLRGLGRLLNFKFDRRAVVVADDGAGGLAAVLSSGNPASAENADSNVALRLHGSVLQPLLASELAVARFSGWGGSIAPQTAATDTPTTEPVARAQVLTEGAIGDALLERIQASARGDAIDIAALYLAHRAVVDALLAASRRGVSVRLILDPNEDALGTSRTGIPNQPTASEIIAASDGAIRVRWYRTHGERFRGQVALIHDPERLWVTLGSASLTRRALDDYDLDANVAFEVDLTSALARQMLAHFDTLWNNRAPAGIEYTADAAVFADPSQVRYWGCRLMEALGLSTF
jgi:hypothetical protein